MSLVYKIVSQTAWTAAHAAGTFNGAEIDLKDGYIHLSTADQAAETARRHFAGVEGLVLAAFETEGLAGLKWEPSRGGDLFPHVYGALDPALATTVTPLPLNAAGWPDPGDLA
ncbi:MAG: DUF952 domain-containing protein [Caulobacteraceae bacterium]